MFKQLTSRLESLYSDAEERRRAKALAVVLPFLAVGTGLYVPVLIPFFSQQSLLAYVVLGFVGAVIVLAGSFWLLLQGRLQAAAWVQAGGCWVIATLFTLLPVGIAPGLAASTVLIYLVLSSIALERRGIFLLVGLYAASLGVIGLMQLGELPLAASATSEDLVAHGLALLLAVVVAGIAQGIISGQLSDSVLTAQAQARGLQSLVNVGQSMSAFLNPDDVLDSAAGRLQEEFGLSYVQIFLLDRQGRFAEPRAGTVEVGQSYNVPVSLETVIGQAVVLDKPITLQAATREELSRYHDELLPDALSRMVVPLRTDDGVIGVLDMQSISPEAFSQADVPIMQALADQIAVAVVNARTFASKAALLEEASPLLQAVYDIARVSSPREIVDVLREHVLFHDIDRIGVVQVGFGPVGEPMIETVTAWDRDNVAPDAEFPEAIRQHVGNRQIVISDTAIMHETDVLLRVYAEETLHARSVVIFPLPGRDRTAGYLVFASRQPRPYADRELHMLDTLSGQIAVVMESLSLLDAFGRQTVRLSMVNELTQGIAGTLELDELGSLIVENLGQILPLTHLSVALPRPDQSGVEIVTLHGLRMPPQLPLSGTCIEQALVSRRAMKVDDVGDWQDGSLWMDAGVHSVIISPMAAGGQKLGTLNVGGADVESFGYDDVMLCEQVATQMAVSLENRRLFDRLQASLEETTTLYSTALAMNAAQSLREVYDTALSEIVHLSHADRVVLYLAGPDPRSKIEYVDAVAVWRDGMMSPPGSEVARHSLSSAPILSQFPQSRSDMVFNNIQSDQRLDEELRADYVLEGVNALMMIPLSTGAIWLGALLVEGRRGQLFTGEQMRLCRNVVDQAALAINSHWALERSQRVAIREQTLREIAERIRSAEDAEAIQRIAADELAIVIGRPSEKLDSLSLDDYVGRTLSAAERELVESVANQVALAIENLELLGSTQRSALREQLVSDVTIQLQRAASVDDVLSTTVQALQSILDDYDITLRLTPPVQDMGSRLSLEMPDDGSDDGKTT